MPAFSFSRMERANDLRRRLEVIWLMLWRGGAFGSGFFAVALVEAIDASCGVDQFLFTGKERVAGRTNFDVQVALLGRTSLKRLATSASNSYFDVFWVYSWFHFTSRHSL